MSEYPQLVETGGHARRSGYNVDREFRCGLDLILDAQKQTATSAAG
jgi:hypothetical protein